MPELSFIIPLYNTEQYITECLSSILDTDADKALYEVIVIDDGATDRSAAIVSDLCLRYPNLSLIHQENQGVSVARMNGIRHACGEFIWFVDSDDYITRDATRKVLSLIHDFPDADAFVTPMLISFEDGRKSDVSPVFETSFTTSGKELMKRKDFVLVGPPHFIVKRNMFADKWLYFPTGIRYEDEYYARVLKYRAGQLLVLKDYLYVYRQWIGSHMNSIQMSDATDVISVYRHLDRFAKEEVTREDQPWFRNNIVSFLLESYTRFRSRFGTEEFRAFRCANQAFLSSEWKKYQMYFSAKDRILARTLLSAPVLYSKLIDLNQSRQLRKKRIH